jgi:exonuclease III
MIGGFWNIRGLRKPGRTKALCDFIKNNKLDFVGVQEKKHELFETTLNLYDSHMTWNYLPAKGSAGGILVGFNNSTLEALRWLCFDYCISAIVRN